MEICKEFENLRCQLSPIVYSWPKILEELRVKIGEEPDKDKRLSYIVEYNRFKDLLYIVNFIKNDDIAIYKKTKVISSIRCEIYKNSEYENIGTNILEMVNTILDETNIKIIVSKINHAIKLIKIGKEVIAAKTLELVIERLNMCIIKRNKLVKNPMHGIIIQLEEDNDFSHCMARICSVRCAECNNIMQFSGHSDRDIYAPIKCSKCNSFELKECSNEEFKNLTQIAEKEIVKTQCCNIQ
jgi:hypothetical protein